MDTPITLTLIGYWIASLKDDVYPPPQELVAEYDADARRAVAAYLDTGEVYAACRGHSWCRFGCPEQNGHRELTDGRWVWPEGLSHYVRAHDVRLPDAFIRDALAATAPALALPFDRLSARVDTAFWVEWCATHRSGALRERLQSARSAADEEVERLLREFMEEVAEEERVVGLSEVLCAWAGCTSRTPMGRRICVVHSRMAALTARLEEPYWEIRRALNIGPIDSPLIHRTR